MVNQLKNVPVGTKIRFAEEKQAYTVQARNERYLVCTKPFNARRTKLYTIVDLEKNIRGTENLIFPHSFETQKQCEEAVERLSGKYYRQNGMNFYTEVSRRNNIPLCVLFIKEPK